MAEIVHETWIKAPPERVYAALTTQEGLASHWTDRVEAQPEAGTTSVFTFGPFGEWVYRMRVDELEPNALVRWHVVDAADPEWVGTEVGWTLTASDGGTRLRFVHSGWPSIDTTLGGCSYIWAMVISRLARYAETGERNPWFTREGG